jgi:LPPG:FO 2-phospho-L-lactate transferase
MKALGVKPSALGVAELYKDFLDTLIIDRVDKSLEPQIESLGIKVIVTNTLMRTMADKVRLAKRVLSEFKR